jgi:hypothetical protein
MLSVSSAIDLDRLDEIGCALGLDPHKRRQLTAIVIDIRETIGAHQVAVNSRMPRRERNKRFEAMSKALACLEENLTAFSGHKDRTLSRIYATMLGQQLSNAGIESALGRRLFWPEPDARLLDSREANEREGSYALLEAEHYRPARESIARAHTSEIVQGHIRQFRQRLDAFFALDRAHNRGGAKEKTYRKHAIAVLAEAFPSLFDAEPTGSPGGTFCTLCEHVLPELGEDTDGLDTAVQRVLKDIRA